MDSINAVGACRAIEPMQGGAGPPLKAPEPQTNCETMEMMQSPHPLPIPRPNDCCKSPCECVVFRYVPPPRRSSAKPIKAYCPTKTPFDDRSIYRISYLPVCGRCVDRRRIVHPSTQSPPCVPMRCESTYRVDFPYWGCVERLNSMKPCHRRTVGEGCISDVSTFRADFKPPMCPVVPPKVYPVPALTTPDVPMEGMSMMRASYTAPRCIEPRAAYKQMICSNCAPFDDCTLHRLNYVPWPVCRPTVPPWARSTAFAPPDKPIEGVSMYSSSYLPPGSFVQVPCSDLLYEKKMEAYDPCRILGSKPGFSPKGPPPPRQHTGLCSAKGIC